MSGQYFSGASVELTPGKLRFKAGYGNLENPLAQIDTLLDGPKLLPTYKRNVIAALLGYGSSNNFIDLIVFKAKDDINGTNLNLIDPTIIKPEENLVVGTKFGVSLFNKLTLKANVAASAHSANQENASGFNYTDTNNAVNRLDNVLTVNLSSKLQFAGNASIDFKLRKFGIGIDYRRVDPLYKSLGTYYFQEDYQNFTLKVNFSALNNKIRFRGSGGVQENNLNKLRTSTKRRKIFNGSLTVSPIRTFTTTIRVSNFTSDRTLVLNTLNDSLQFTQTTEVYSISPVVIFNRTKTSSTIALMATFQKLIDLGLNLNGARGVDNYTGNISYNLLFKESKLSVGTSILANRNVIGDNENARLGANIRASKRFMDKKLSVSAGLGITKNFINNISDGNTVIGNIGLRFKLKRSMNISLNTNILNRDSKVESYKEYRGTLKVSYQFSTKK